MKVLNKEETLEVELAESRAKSLGLETMVRAIKDETYVLDEQKYIKFNIPNTVEKYERGSGEGVWAQPLTDEDMAIYDNEESIGEKFKVVILNTAFTFTFDWGCVITVETRGPQRPVLSFDWFDSVVQKSSNGEMTLSKMLEDLEG